MCGIVGAIAERDVVPILLEGLKRLEYRGYDSAGIAVIAKDNQLQRVRSLGKVQILENELKRTLLCGTSGIAHTRWATHGKPSERNAHPHVSRDKVALVHNGTIENHEQLRNQQKANFEFTSETDTEVIAHQVCVYLEKNKSLFEAVQATTRDLIGAYALGVVSRDNPDVLVAACHGSPLVIGVGIGEYFIASDMAALIPVTQQYIVLEDGDVAELRRDSLKIVDKNSKPINRPLKISELNENSINRGRFRHFMLKEIYDQPLAIGDTLEGRISQNRVIDAVFGVDAAAIFDTIQNVQILACGTSYHAGLIARYWLEAIAGVRCNVEVASEFRYRKPVVLDNCLVVTISQSGETSDTIAALNEAKKLGFGHSLSICNVPESSLVRKSDLVLMTRAGREIGVASTKAFTTQLAALMMLVLVLGRRHGLSAEREKEICSNLKALPRLVEEILKLDAQIKDLAEDFKDKEHALFLGRGPLYPVALEGALKLKEISYIHAEAYPAGELKHGPLALVDESMPVVAVAPNNELLEKLKSNLQVVSARGGKLYIFADESMSINADTNTRVIPVPRVDDCLAPILYTVPLQLLAYHVARLRGTDIDQPRNLAKSVTVE